jgi:CRP-like cAMP-binding protein
MLEIFKSHIKKFAEISEEEFADIAGFFKLQQVKKKENLQVEGKICRFHYFVLRGCLRLFFIKEKGIEQTTEFAIETWWMTDNISYEHRRPGQFFIQAVEDSHVLRIDRDAQEKLVASFPLMERYFRFIYQRAYASTQMRMKYLYDLSKEESFHHLVEHHPDFVKRIPQHLVASYLGFTPEYLSEILKKARS